MTQSPAKARALPRITVLNKIDRLDDRSALTPLWQVDPRAIRPGNSVSSTQVANVRVEQRGRGAQAEAQMIGWLARVFLSVLPI